MRLEEFLEQNAQIHSFAKGQILFSEGDQADAAYYIISGKIEIYKTLREAPATMAMLGPEQIFGEMALLRYDDYTLSAKAVEETSVYIITPDLLHNQIRETHPLVKAILDGLLERIHGVNELLIDIDRASGG